MYVIEDVVNEAMGESMAAAAIKDDQVEHDEAAAAMTTTASTNKRALPLMGKNKKQKLEPEEEVAAV